MPVLRVAIDRVSADQVSQHLHYSRKKGGESNGHHEKNRPWVLGCTIVALASRSPPCKVFNAAAERATLIDLHFHKLRHTLAIHIMMNGVNLTILKELLGHESTHMTVRELLCKLRAERSTAGESYRGGQPHNRSVIDRDLLTEHHCLARRS